MLTVTSAHLLGAAPSGDPAVITAIATQSGRVFEKYGINNRNRALGFLSTAFEESGGFRTLTENLNYSAERAHEVWPSKFPTVADAVPYAHNPAALANKVYGGRMGNASTNDGWRYRGQGLIQITGHDNFALLEKLTGLPLVDHPELATNAEHMLECSVALFIRYTGILNWCDAGQFSQVWALVGSGRANGPVINLSNHQAALARLESAIAATVAAPTATLPPAHAADPLAADVMSIQTFLVAAGYDLDIDGLMDPNGETVRAFADYRSHHPAQAGDK